MARQPWMPEPALTVRSSPPGSAVRELSGIRIWTVMVRAGRLPMLTERVKAEYGLDLPTGPRRTAKGGDALLGIGPGKWLFARASDAPPVGGLDGLASIVEQTGGMAVLELRGAVLHEALARAVGVDLAPAAFPPGSVAGTLIEDVGIILVALDEVPPAYQLFVPRSFAEDVGEMLARWAEDAAWRGGPRA